MDRHLELLPNGLHDIQLGHLQHRIASVAGHFHDGVQVLHHHGNDQICNAKGANDDDEDQENHSQRTDPAEGTGNLDHPAVEGDDLDQCPQGPPRCPEVAPSLPPLLFGLISISDHGCENDGQGVRHDKEQEANPHDRADRVEQSLGDNPGCVEPPQAADHPHHAKQAEHAKRGGQLESRGALVVHGGDDVRQVQDDKHVVEDVPWVGQVLPAHMV
mmetsp:Transcript_13985/g.32864  ORF Transcript_13985/g.32864 Transcript_13985/m.32864 type:complete len:216 (+) Transcript_13985:613-1260(+)